MAIQNIRTWQWMFFGLVTGLLVAMAWNLSSSDGDAENTWPVSRFCSLLNQKNDNGDPILVNIVVDPMMKDNQDRQVQRVHFWMTARNRNTNKWDPVEQHSSIVIMPILNDRPDYRIQDYIKEQQENNPKIKYKYAWWKLSDIPGDRETHPWQTAKMSWIALGGMGFVLIGVIWPAMIKSMIKLGILPPPDERVDLSKVKNVKEKPKEKSGPRVTRGDLASLDDLNTKLEASVGDMLIKADERDEAAERKKEAAVIKKLSNMPLEQQQTNSENDEPKEYQGEFYPVVKPHHHEEHDKPADDKKSH